MCLCVLTQVMHVTITKMACDKLSAPGYHVVVPQLKQTILPFLCCINVALYKYYFSYETCRPVDMSNAASAPPYCSKKDTSGYPDFRKLFCRPDNNYLSPKLP